MYRTIPMNAQEITEALNEGASCCCFLKGVRGPRQVTACVNGKVFIAFADGGQWVGIASPVLEGFEAYHFHVPRQALLSGDADE